MSVVHGNKSEAEIRALAEAFGLAPMVDWAARYARLSEAERYEVEREMSARAVHYARASAYLSRRMNGGTHGDAVKRQNQTAAKVRGALGYTYKEAPITF